MSYTNNDWKKMNFLENSLKKGQTVVHSSGKCDALSLFHLMTGFQYKNMKRNNREAFLQ